MFQFIKNYRSERNLQKEHSLALQINEAIDLQTKIWNCGDSRPENFAKGASNYARFYTFLNDHPEVITTLEGWIEAQRDKSDRPKFVPTPPKRLDSSWS